MYLDHFELQDHPFRLTPDADYLYLTPQHARAKACMEQACVQRDALVVITGEVGCGKSVLVNRVVAEMPEGVAIARLTHTNLDTEEFLHSVLSQYGFEPFERNRHKLMSLLDNFLFAQNVRERPVILVIEEAQNLSKSVLNVVSDLADLEEDSEKLISIVLVGQPSLQERLRDRELRTVAERVSCSAHLEPLDQAETTRLIRHRLKIAGCEQPPFEDSVYPAIFEFTGGVPRLIVNLCDTAMTAAYVEETRTISAAILSAAIEELELKPVAEADPGLDVDADPAETERAVTLHISEKGSPRGSFEVGDTRVMIGRDADNDVTLVSEFISRHHAQVVMDHEGRYWVKDLNSTNGIYVNGRKANRCVLSDGDRIALGYHELLFRDSGFPAGSGVATDIGQWRETAVFNVPHEDEADNAV